MSTKNSETEKREAQGLMAEKLDLAMRALKEAKALADEHGLHFSFEAPNAGGGFTYYGEADGDGSYSLDGEWYNSNC